MQRLFDIDREDMLLIETDNLLTYNAYQVMNWLNQDGRKNNNTGLQNLCNQINLERLGGFGRVGGFVGLEGFKIQDTV